MYLRDHRRCSTCVHQCGCEILKEDPNISVCSHMYKDKDGYSYFGWTYTWKYKLWNYLNSDRFYYHKSLLRDIIILGIIIWFLFFITHLNGGV